jgi:hypothetical protein
MSKRASEYMLPTDFVMWWVSMTKCEDSAIPEFHSREELHAFEQETRAKRSRIGKELCDAMRPLAPLASAYKSETVKLMKLKKFAVINSDWPCGLPPEIWLKVANNLDPLSLLTMTCTTRRWRELLVSKESLLEYYRAHVSRWGVEAPKMLAAIDAFDEPKRLFNFSMILMQLAGTWVMHGALRPTGGVEYRPYTRINDITSFRTKGAIGTSYIGNVIYADGKICKPTGTSDFPFIEGDRILSFNRETGSLWDITGGFDFGVMPYLNTAFVNIHERQGTYAIDAKDGIHKVQYGGPAPTVTKILSYRSDTDPRGVCVRVSALVGDDGEIYVKTKRLYQKYYERIPSNSAARKNKIWNDAFQTFDKKWVPDWIRIGGSGRMSSYRRWRLEHSDGAVRVVSPESEVIFSFKYGLAYFCKIGPSGILLENCCFFFFTFKAKTANPSRKIVLNRGRAELVSSNKQSS